MTSKETRVQTVGISNRDKKFRRRGTSRINSYSTSSKSIPSGKRSIRTKPVVQAVRYAASKAKSWQEHEENSKSAWNSKMHRIFKNGLRHTACRKQSRQLRSRPSSGLTRRSLHSRGCYQDAGMYVMQIFCLKVVVPIFVISNQLE